MPEVLRSAKTVVTNKKDCSEPKQKKKRTDNNETMLLNFLKEKEIAKERRHNEKMNLLKILLGDKYVTHV